MISFGDRASYGTRHAPKMISTLHPSDFGTLGYANRREDAIARHLQKMPQDRADLLWEFDYILPHSEGLREYLWAHERDVAARARTLIEVLPPSLVIAILRYLIKDYWGRYLGWPDLLLVRDDSFLFVEVKSSADHLSEEQKRWIADNYDQLRLPFALVKIHREIRTTS
jgi:hypothetical protein